MHCSQHFANTRIEDKPVVVNGTAAGGDPAESPRILTSLESSTIVPSASHNRSCYDARSAGRLHCIDWCNL